LIAQIKHVPDSADVESLAGVLFPLYAMPVVAPQALKMGVV